MNFFSNVYLHKDAGAKYLSGLSVRSIVLEVDRPAAVEPFVMILPTDKPESVDAALIAGWLAALNGQSVDTSGMSSSQHELLLTLICGYRAFLELPPTVKESDFYTLTHKLIDAAFELVTCFLLVLDDSYKLRDPEKLSKDDVTGIVTTFASMLDPHVREVIQDIDIDAILSAAPTSATSPPSPTSAKPNLASTKSKSRKHITDAGAVPPDVDATTTQSVTCSAAADNAELTLPAVGVHVQAAATAPVDGAPASAPGLAHGETIPRASRAVTIKEVPDVEALHCAPVLDVKGKGRAAVLEAIAGDSNDELPGLVDVEGSSDDSDREGGAHVDLVQVLTNLARVDSNL
ncbi:hypothetical protein GSI_06976 [Ganoderma sinense ZZ0214-1]|uniref:Uncharacterized protein n=1 Tax=Ganoderma sinense ZZ0214-1 TaxID=1077348 RepID=A0A2G8SB27_9APHY|nr:hypothetical protein GSI_06976 [Ganoderma sinense ZZ0214-1]